MCLTFPAPLLLIVLLNGGPPMVSPTRSDSPISELQKSLEDPRKRWSTLCFLRDYSEDCRILLPTLVKLLQEAFIDENYYEYLGESLAAAGKGALPHLIEALPHRNSCVRRCALIAIKKMGPPARSAVPALIARLADEEDQNAGLEVFEAIGAIGPEAKEAVPALIKCVQNGRAKHREFAAGALAHIGPAAKEAVPALIAALSEKRIKADRDSDVSHKCISALGGIGPEARAAVPTLLRILEKDGGAAKGELEEYTISLLHTSALLALSKIGVKNNEVIMAMTKRLASPDASDRLFAAECLRDLDPGNQLAFFAVVKEMKNEEAEVRGRAALTLIYFGPRAKAALPLLREMLAKDPDEENRSFAKVAIEKIESSR